MADACSIAAGRAIAQIEKLGRQAITEAVENAKIRNKTTKNALLEDLKADYEEHLKNLREQLSPENILDEGVIEKVDLENQRQLFNMVERVRTTRNTLERLDLVFRTTKTKDRGAIEGGLREAVSLQDKAMENIRTRINNMEDRIVSESLEGGTSKNPDAVERSKLAYLDAKTGGDMLHRILAETGVTNTGYVIWKAIVKDGHYQGLDELNIIATNLKKLKKETQDLIKKEYPNYEIPSDALNFRLDKAKVLDAAEFNNFVFKNAEPHVFLGMSKERFEALGEKGFDVFRDSIEKTRQEIASSGFDPLKLGEPGAGPRKNPFKKTKLKMKTDAAEFELLRRFGDTKEGIVGAFVTNNRFQATKAAEKSVMSDRSSLQFSAMRDYIVDRFELKGDEIKNANLYVEQLSDYWRGSYHPINTVDETFALIALGSKQLINASLLGFVNGRNITIDNTLFHGVVKHTHTGDSRIMTALKQASKLLYASGRGTVLGVKGLVSGRWLRPEDRKLTKQQEIMVDAFENAGLVIQVAQPDMVMGALRRSGEVDPLLHRSENETLGRKAARGFAKISSELADLASVTSGAEATNKVARIEAAIASTSLLNRFFNEGNWGALKDADRSLLEGMGIDEKVFDILKKLEIDENGIVSYESYRKADVSSLVDDFTSATQARTHIMQIHKAALSELMDRYAPLPGLKGEVALNRPRHGLAALVIDSVFKYANISLKAYQAIMKSMLAYAGLDPNRAVVHQNFLEAVISPLARALELGKKNPYYLGQSLTLLAAGGVAHGWATNVKNNQPLEALTPESVGKGILKTPSLGLVSEMAQGLYWEGGLIGDPTKAVVRSAANIYKGTTSLAEGKKKKAIQQYLRAKQTMPVTNVWWLNIGIDKAVRNGMNIPYTSYQKTQFRKRGKLRDQFR